MSAAEYEVTVKVRLGDLRSYSDAHLSTLWHVAQINPAPHGDREAGEMAEYIGREIIRRFVTKTDPEVWKHQGRDYFWNELRQLGKWKDGVFVADATPGDDSKAGAA